MRRVIAGVLTLAAVVGFGHDTRAEPRPPAEAREARKEPRQSKAVATLASLCAKHERKGKQPPPPPDTSGFKVIADGGTAVQQSELAGAIAAALGRPVDRVELRAIVGKYIGETEKNLNVVLERAERLDVVLFLDEGDALFGRRTNVKDSHDRYANQEVSYVLQRLRAHEGIVVFGAKLTDEERAEAARQVHRILKATVRGREMWAALC